MPDITEGTIEEGGEPIVDPGAQEGVRLPKDNPPPVGGERWNEVYGKMKSFERELQESKKEKESLSTLIDEMKSWNQQLAESLENNSNAIATAITDKGSSDVTVTIDKITSQIKQLKDEYKSAMKDVDYDAASDINEKMMELKLDLKELKEAKEKPKPTNTDDVSQRKSAEIHPDVLKFTKNTPWYAGEFADPEMKAYANMLDDVLITDPKWKGQPGKRLEEVKSRVEKRFNWNNPNRDQVSGVEGGNGGRPGKGDEGAGLTPTELELARGLGISPDVWIKQKNAIKKGKK